MKRLGKTVWFVFLSLRVVPAALAQDDTYPAIAREALETTRIVCQQIGRNQICYGNELRKPSTSRAVSETPPVQKPLTAES